MTEYNALNMKLPDSQINKLIPGIKKCTEVILKLSSKIVGGFINEKNFPHKLLLTNTQVSKPRKAFANSSSANIKLSKAQLNKIGQLGGLLGRPLVPLRKTGSPLIKNVLNPVAKCSLMPLRLTATASATDAAIHRKCLDQV